MGQLVDAFDLTVDVPLYLVSRPRLSRLMFGLLCLPLGGLLLWHAQVAAYWQSTPLGDPQVAGLMALLVGIFYVVKSALDDLLHVHRISFSENGVRLVWSHAPKLCGQRTQKERVFQWSDLAAVAWIEGHQEHVLAQHLELAFKEKIGLSKRRIKVLVSDDRNPEHCEKLIAFLPHTFTIPEWLDAARKKNHGGAASSP